jgi:hypothetical protein
MAYKNYTPIKAIEYKNRQRLLAVNPGLNNMSGIYFLSREDEDGFKYAHVGQAKDILQRLCSHLVGYQHIDLSLKKHGLYSQENPYGWKVNYKTFPISQLDEKEQYYIKMYALNGYQLRNKTSGSQGQGKRQIDEYKPSRGYRDGLHQGRKNASKEVSHLFDKHLEYTTKNNPPTKNQQKAVEKFEEFLNFHNIDNGSINTEKEEFRKYGRVVSSGSE